jgi:hypothetical protein
LQLDATFAQHPRELFITRGGHASYRLLGRSPSDGAPKVVPIR